MWTKSWTAEADKGGLALFTNQERNCALKLFEERRSVTETIRILGYPGRQTLYKWISEKINHRRRSQSIVEKIRLSIPAIPQSN